MTYRATTVTNVVYATASTGSFDQAPGSSPLSNGVASIYPQSAMYNPVMKSRLGVNVTVGTPVGQNVSFVITSNDSGRTIENGDIVEMISQSSDLGATIVINGVNYPATGAGVRAAYAALVALNGGHGRIEVAENLPIDWGTAEPLNIQSSEFEFFAPASSPIRKPATAYAFCPICVNITAGSGGVVTAPTNGTGPSGTARALSANFLQDTHVATFGTKPTVNDGDYVMFTQDSVALEGDFAWITRVVSQGANTLTLEDGAPIDITTAQTGTCQKIVLLENVKVTATIKQNGNTGVGGGFFAYYLGPGCDIDIRAYDVPTAGSRVDWSYRLKREHVYAENCGDAFVGSIFNFRVNLCDDLQLVARKSVSHGIINRACVLKGGTLDSQVSNGRNIKNHHVWRSWFERAIGNYSQSPGAGASTGISTTGSSYDVTYLYAEALSNWSGGFFCTGPNNAPNRVRFISGVARNNNLGTGSADIDIQAGAVSWYVGPGVDFGTLLDAGTKSSIIGRYISPAYAGGDYTANGGATITVDAGDVAVRSYVMLTPNLMALKIALVTVSITVATPTIIDILLPNGRTANGSARVKPVAVQAGVNAPAAMAYVDNGDTKVHLIPDLAGTGWALAANNLTIEFDMLVPVAD